MCYLRKVRTLILLEVFFYDCTDTWRIFYSIHCRKAMVLVSVPVPNPNLSGETPKINRLSHDQVPSNTLANVAIKTAKSAKI